MFSSGVVYGYVYRFCGLRTFDLPSYQLGRNFNATLISLLVLLVGCVLKSTITFIVKSSAALTFQIVLPIFMAGL